MSGFAKKVAGLGERITRNIDLLEIVKCYCEHNFDKGREICTVGSALEVILKEQRAIADSFDCITD